MVEILREEDRRRDSYLSQSELEVNVMTSRLVLSWYSPLARRRWMRWSVTRATSGQRTPTRRLTRGSPTLSRSQSLFEILISALLS